MEVWRGTLISVEEELLRGPGSEQNSRSDCSEELSSPWTQTAQDQLGWSHLGSRVWRIDQQPHPR